MHENDAPQHKFMSILITNLDVNYDAWKAELPSEENEDNKEEKDDVSTVIYFEWYATV